MNREEIKKIAKEEFINNVMKNIDSALIFTYISNLEVENKRLNNIIEEFEKWLEEKQELTCGCGITRDYIYAYENCLEQLKELKEGK